MHSDHYQSDEMFGVLRDLLLATKLKRVYQKSVQGVALDMLWQVAAEVGVQLIWGERPKEWPVSVDEVA